MNKYIHTYIHTYTHTHTRTHTHTHTQMHTKIHVAVHVGVPDPVHLAGAGDAKRRLGGQGLGTREVILQRLGVRLCLVPVVFGFRV